jgi:UDP-glucose 6-dehydrogenase
MVKYVCNVFYAVKNATWNAFRFACETGGADFDRVRDMAVRNGFIHPVHTYSPGRDGKRGFGGACLPKDLSAFIGWAEFNGIMSGLFREARSQNEIFRMMGKEEARREWEEYFMTEEEVEEMRALESQADRGGE